MKKWLDEGFGFEIEDTGYLRGGMAEGSAEPIRVRR